RATGPCAMSASPPSFRSCSRGRHPRAPPPFPTRRSSDLVALAHQCPRVHLVATDLSAEALEVARANAERHGVLDRIEFVQGDLCDRKSTRLNSSHVKISYAVFCLKKRTHRDLISVTATYE